MKSTTLPPMKVGKNQKLLPSGVVVSADGKYHYWQCSVSGLMTFAKPDYWVKIMAKYGSEENLVKTYVCKKAAALVADGKSQAEVIKILSMPVTAEDRKARKETKAIKAERKAVTKRAKKVRLKSFAVGTAEVAVTTDSGSIEVQKVPVYAWQNDPNYFKSPPTTLSIAEATKDACAYPARYLDDECRNCPVYAECACALKYTESDWKKPRSKGETKITPIDSFPE
jgi:hypothetical protein